ncbi:mRNA decay activator protein [Scale drop disease virus]|uniref:mRNA decay activator protein n=1 Tax=Scale drop disease virus TaxID=1697349 RepID=A0A7D5YHI1_9VIRU|nr:mRNA decay activator protein [Scale drop disease virus]
MDKHKTKLCYFINNCIHGDSCKYAHSIDELRINTSITQHRYKTVMCRNFVQNGFCEYRTYCTFAHDITELYQPFNCSIYYKKRLCPTFHTVGYCSYGVTCGFIHNVYVTKKRLSVFEALTESCKI